MRVTILQPAFIPWVGYFSMIAQSDIFVFYDDVQFFRPWFINRNRIIINKSAHWLTVPVKHHTKPINQTPVSNQLWIEKHKKSIVNSYRKKDLIDDIFRPFSTIDQVAINSVKVISDYFGLKTEFFKSSELKIHNEDRTKRLVDICNFFGATKYLTGLKSKNYLDENCFSDIELVYFDYISKPYKQDSDSFISHMSILDMLYNIGREETYNIGIKGV